MTLVGVCGLGSIGRRHARVFAALPGVDVLGHDPGLGGEECDGIRLAPDVESLLDAGVDAVVVAAPDAAHADLTVAACRRQVPVLLEKPVAATSADAVRIVAAARSTATPVLVGYVLRHTRCMQRVRALLDARAIGTPLSFQVMLGAYETLALARNRFDGSGYGALFRDYSHEWDYLRWFLAPVDGCVALARRAGAQELQQDPNLVDAVLRLRDGTTGTVHLDYVQAPGVRRVTIVGDGGTLDVDAARGLVRLTTAGGEPREEDLAEARDEAFTAQARHFLDVVSGLSAPLADLDDGLAALRVAEAMQRSAASGRWTPVETG